MGPEVVGRVTEYGRQNNYSIQSKSIVKKRKKLSEKMGPGGSSTGGLEWCCWEKQKKTSVS